MNRLLRAITHRSVRGLTHTAAVLALVGLAMMAFSIVSPRPLPVVLAMSVAHVIGVAAMACYLLGILLTIWRAAPGAVDAVSDAPDAPSVPPSQPPSQPQPQVEPVAPLPPVT